MNPKKLSLWNSEYPLRPYQKKGVRWLYDSHRGLLADPVGLGKTIMALALISLLKVKKEPYKTLIIAPNYATEKQWLSECQKFTSLKVQMIDGPKNERLEQYHSDYEVLLCRYPLILRDYKVLEKLPFDVAILDEASTIRNHSTKTARLVKIITRKISRIIAMDATPIQNSLLDLHSILEAVRLDVFGGKAAFDFRYIKRRDKTVWRGGRPITVSEIYGYRNMTEFQEIVKPLILRRSISEVEVHLPSVVTKDKWLNLPKVQRTIYDNVRNKILSSYQSGDYQKMQSGFHQLQLACDTTVPFEQSNHRHTSIKISWIVQFLKGLDKKEKVIVFSQYLAPVEHCKNELALVGIGTRSFTGLMSNDEKTKSLEDFWNDPQVRVLIGTSALMRGLNLQKSAYVIAINQMHNPQMMEQLIGRVRRIGSKHSRCFMINLLVSDTVEEKIYMKLRERAAVPNWVFDEKSDLFGSLSKEELKELLEE